MKSQQIARFPGIAWRLTCATVLCMFCSTSGYANFPIFSQRFTADPSPIVVDGRVYVFCSHDLDGQDWWLMKDFTCISSDDLVNWTDHGEVFDVTNATAWAEMAWAPQVVAANGKFYLYYTSGVNKEGMKKRGVNATGVAVADKILGPYKDLPGKPLALDTQWTDPTVLVDNDGRGYLYLNQRKMAQLNRDMISLDQPPKMLPAEQLPEFFEGAWITKVNGKYNLIYTQDPWKYDPIYAQAVSDRPDRDFKYKGRWFWMSVDNHGENTHGGFFNFAGKWYMTYHNTAVAQQRRILSRYQRSIGIDRVYFKADGSICPFTSTRDWMPQVKYVNPYARNLAVMMAAESGIETEACAEGGRQLTSIHAGDWIKVQGVDFGKGPDVFSAYVAGGAQGGIIEIFLDSNAGEPVAVCAVSPGDGAKLKWTTARCQVKGVEGVHDLYFRFDGGAGGELFLFQWWEFGGGKPGGAVPPVAVERTIMLKSSRQKYVAVEPGTGLLRLTAAKAESAAKFRLLDNQDGTWSFKDLASGKYVTAGDKVLAAVGSSDDAKGRFFLYNDPDGLWCLARESDGRFVVSNFGECTLTVDLNDVTGPNPRLPGIKATWIMEDVRK